MPRESLSPKDWEQKKAVAIGTERQKREAEILDLEARNRALTNNITEIDNEIVGVDEKMSAWNLEMQAAEEVTNTEERIGRITEIQKEIDKLQAKRDDLLDDRQAEQKELSKVNQEMDRRLRIGATTKRGGTPVRSAVGSRPRAGSSEAAAGGGVSMAEIIENSEKQAEWEAARKPSQETLSVQQSLSKDRAERARALAKKAAEKVAEPTNTLGSIEPAISSREGSYGFGGGHVEVSPSSFAGLEAASKRAENARHITTPEAMAARATLEKDRQALDAALNLKEVNEEMAEAEFLRRGEAYEKGTVTEEQIEAETLVKKPTIRQKVGGFFRSLFSGLLGGVSGSPSYNAPVERRGGFDPEEAARYAKSFENPKTTEKEPEVEIVEAIEPDDDVVGKPIYSQPRKVGTSNVYDVKIPKNKDSEERRETI